MKYDNRQSEKKIQRRLLTLLTKKAEKQIRSFKTKAIIAINADGDIS